MTNDKDAIIQAYTDLNSHIGDKSIFSEFQAKAKQQEESKNQKDISGNTEKKLNISSLDA
jgi:hypothetical protein